MLPFLLYAFSWCDSEPEEPEGEFLSEEEMEAFEQAERDHTDSFKGIEHKAARLAASLGVGKLTDAKLQPALFGFIREGMRFAFSNDDDMLLGSRLSFLLLLLKFTNFLKKQKGQLKQLKDDLLEKETELRSSQDWPDIREEDVDALNKFRKALGFKEEITNKTVVTPATPDGSDDEGQSQSQHSRKSGRSRHSMASSVGSMRSKRSNLSPLIEDSDAEEQLDENTPEPAKKRSRKSAKVAAIKEGSEEEESDASAVS